MEFPQSPFHLMERYSASSGSKDKSIKLWNLKTGQEIRSLIGHTDTISSVAFSPDGKTLASGSADKSIKLWNPDWSVSQIFDGSCFSSFH